MKVTFTWSYIVGCRGLPQLGVWHKIFQGKTHKGLRLACLFLMFVASSGLYSFNTHYYICSLIQPPSLFAQIILVFRFFFCLPGLSDESGNRVATFYITLNVFWIRVIWTHSAYPYNMVSKYYKNCNISSIRL